MPKSHAAIVAKFTSSETVHPVGAIWTGFDNPTKSGPTNVAHPNTCKIFVDMQAEWIAWKIKTLPFFLLLIINCMSN